MEQNDENRTGFRKTGQKSRKREQNEFDLCTDFSNQLLQIKRQDFEIRISKL